MTGRQEYDRNMTGRQDDRQDDRQRTLGKYMIDYFFKPSPSRGPNQFLFHCWRPAVGILKRTTLAEIRQC
jgi:hypothetical protein